MRFVRYRLFIIIFCWGIISAVTTALPAKADDCLHGNNIRSTENRTVPAFQAIDVQGAFEVTIQRQTDQHVTVSADKNLIPHIQTEVRDGTLFIAARRSICTRLSLDLNIAGKDIRTIRSSGANDIAYKNVRTDTLTIDLIDAGEIKLAGQTQVMEATLSGAAEMAAENLRAEEVRIKVMDAGDAAIHVRQKLDAVITDAGSITYQGNPPVISKRVSVAGDLTRE